MDDDGHAELLAAVDDLAVAMKAKLEQNRHKSGRIEDAGISWLFGRAEDELRELSGAVDAWSGAPVRAGFRLEAIRDEAADAANFCLFIWVAARRIDQRLGADAED